LKIKQLGIPIAEQAQPEPQPLSDLMTLREMQDIDPYDFLVLIHFYLSLSLSWKFPVLIYSSFMATLIHLVLYRKLAAVVLLQLFVWLKAVVGGIHHAIYAKSPANQMIRLINALNVTTPSGHTSKIPYVWTCLPISSIVSTIYCSQHTKH
jgi:hypothetical protein